MRVTSIPAKSRLIFNTAYFIIKQRALNHFKNPILNKDNLCMIIDNFLYELHLSFDKQFYEIQNQDNNQVSGKTKMIQLIIVLTGIACFVAAAVIIAKIQAALKLQKNKKREARKHSIKPSVSFYLKKDKIYLKNSGLGRAINISISDFYHPEEKEWRFKFQGINLLDPGEEKAIEFNFLVSTYEASNKTDQLWIFDPDHDHDFAARVIISYCDIDKNSFKQTIIIGEEKKKQNSKIRNLQLIQKAMSRK